MSGGYYLCGRWQGEDKSASTFFQVLQGIEKHVLSAQDEDPWESDVAALLKNQLTEFDDGEPPSLELDDQIMKALIPFSLKYAEVLLERHDHPDRSTWHEIGDWKSGDGWQLLCIEDLVRAHEISTKCGKPVTVEFD